MARGGAELGRAVDPSVRSSEMFGEPSKATRTCWSEDWLGRMNEGGEQAQDDKGGSANCWPARPGRAWRSLPQRRTQKARRSSPLVEVPHGRRPPV